MNKKKEDAEFLCLSDPEVEELCPNAKEALELLRNCPSSFRLKKFLFPSERMAQGNITTKDRFLTLCKQVDALATIRKSISRFKRIEKALKAPDNPKPFSDYLCGLRDGRGGSLLLPLQLHTRGHSNSLRCARYLGHPNLAQQHWLAAGSLGAYFNQHFKFMKAGGGVSQPDSVDVSQNDTNHLPPNKEYLNLYRDMMCADELDCETINKFVDLISSYPYNISSLPLSEKLQLMHLIDNYRQPQHKEVTIHRHNMHYLFTDGANIYHKIGVFCAPEMAKMMQFPTKYVTLKKSTKGEASNIYYAMVNVRTMAPKVFNFKYFVPAGEELPKKGGPYFTIASFAPTSNFNISTTKQRLSKATAKATLQASRYGYGTIASHKMASVFPQEVSTKDLYCIQTGPAYSLYSCMQSLANSYAFASPDDVGYRVHYSNEGKYTHPKRNFQGLTAVAEHAAIPFFNFLIPLLNENNDATDPLHWYARHYDTLVLKTRKDIPQVEGSKVYTRLPFDITGARNTDSINHPPYKELFTTTLTEDSPIASCFNKQEFKNLCNHSNFGPLGMAGSYARVDIVLTYEHFQREMYERAVGKNLSAYAFVLTTPLASNGNAAPWIIPQSTTFPTLYNHFGRFGQMPAPTFSGITHAEREHSAPFDTSRVLNSPMNRKVTHVELRNSTLSPLLMACRDTSIEDTVLVSGNIPIQLSPLTYSEGAICVAPSLNTLAALSKWVPVLDKLKARADEVTSNIINNCPQPLAPSTLHRHLNRLNLAMQ